MAYKSNLNGVKAAIKAAQKDACTKIGTYVTAEAQMRAPVLTGNMRRSTTFDVLDDNSGVYVGVTPEADYAQFVEKGTSKQVAQPFIEPAVMDNISKIEHIAGEAISTHMGGV